MSDERLISRRAFAGGVALFGFQAGRRARAQGFAGLGSSAEGFAPVVPDKVLSFPEDLGPHPDFRIEWWYVTANLTDSTGAACGLQWTLFRQAEKPGPQLEGWANQQIWMGHAAVTRPGLHRFSETFARGGIGQAGVTAKPFEAWIDAWKMRGLDGMDDRTIAPLELRAAGSDFSYALKLDADKPLVLQGDAGYSRKSQRGQASYYFSQPFFTATGQIVVDDKPIEITGQAWMDREWSSQPLASDQTGWDWFSLHIKSGGKLMLFRLRQTNGNDYVSGNWISPEGKPESLSPQDIKMTPEAVTEIGSRKLPTTWRIEIPLHRLAIETVPLNPRSWMATSFPYWEGPIGFTGSHTGVGYLEMTGY
jgi:predicted secreted hydrolase